MKKQLLALVTLSILFVACSKKKESTPKLMLDLNELSLKFDKEHQFKVTLDGQAVDGATVNWTSSDERTGTIGGTGLFKAKRIGTTTITAKRGEEVLTATVDVTPYSTFFVEPYIDFTASKAVIKTKEKRLLAPNGEDADELLFIGENNKIQNVFYAFENGTLLGAMAVFNTSTLTSDELAKFYLERYAYIGETDDLAYLAFGQTIVAIGEHPNVGFAAVYIQDPERKTASTRSLGEARALVEAYSGKLVKRLR
ncbi:Ig-like domain-containing protein [Pedobacter deserti]|uniref:Ig-like domain-containing protein n=1 Tax=Pedobacter deserti TaxID=2817382 RepID=UPI002108F839|nr:Ig-like domain-containing protein [Pedobacter sp. SYSU D00382]